LRWRSASRRQTATGGHHADVPTRKIARVDRLPKIGTFGEGKAAANRKGQHRDANEMNFLCVDMT
jgi:hypothetical protein